MNNRKEGARRLEREVSRAQTLSLGNRTYQQSPGFGHWGFCYLSLDHGGPEVAVRTPAGGA